MVKIIVIAVGGFFTLWSGYTVFFEGNLEQPSFSVLEKEGNFQVRMYESFRVAQTEQKRGEENLRQGFRKVAGYLFGGNEEQRSMSMTAPVIQENHNEGIRVAFVMSTKEVDVPIPHDEDVVLSRVEWGRVAVIRFSGYGNQKRFQKKEEVLRAWMQKKGIEGEDMGIYAQYNSPYAFPLLRRNEVLIRLK